ncbi:hypothetical protein BC937DRAFT_92163 [Endogone sp. FLAS-F59071]|nr:hypothetical protein BC937DRAFT_92163 [Endogone sp. FLAS-F59071]|eukprot:RUS21588.1 hypothetical protein BC937DRAFT_92163 [Endogone sp. FLAS-F59071]
MYNEPIVCKVVVVGAGLSGLQTARLLHKQGVDVHVLEANETIGGRAKAHSFGEDGAIDVGGQWVGKNQKHVIKLLEEFGIPLYQQYSKGKAVQAYPKYGNKTFTGMIPPLSVKGLLDLQFNGINQVERLMAGVNVDEPSLSDNAIEFDNTTVESFVGTHCGTEDAKQTIALATRCIFGAEMGEISFLFFLYALKTAGDGLCLFRGR